MPWRFCLQVVAQWFGLGRLAEAKNLQQSLQRLYRQGDARAKQIWPGESQADVEGEDSVH